MRTSGTLRPKLPPQTTKGQRQSYRLRRRHLRRRNGSRLGRDLYAREDQRPPSRIDGDAARRKRQVGEGNRSTGGFSLCLIRSALIRPNSDSNVYMSARKSMTVRFFIHSIAKRAEAIALLDSGATENFMNLSYAKWLKLPIKQLPKPRKLFNVDGTENRSGDLRHYTVLNVRTGSTTLPLQFFLSDLGDHKVILGYPWFAAMQPKIDWKRGWIDHTHLPIIFRSPDAKKAEFLPRGVNRPRPIRDDRYFIGRVTLHPPNEAIDHSQIPRRYRRHAKVFSEQQSQRLPAHSIR